MTVSDRPLGIVLHTPTPEALSRARRNLANILTDDPRAQVELVVNAAAARIAAAQPDSPDPHLRLCANSLRAHGLSAPPHAVVVPTAILHMAWRQREGWAYIGA